MNRDEAIKNVCLMPRTFNERGDISMVDLFSEIGGLSIIDNLTELDLSKALRNIPGIIDSWLQMSEDDRSGPAWYFRKSNEGTKWEVGYYPSGKLSISIIR